jgi:hypothetical protein
MKQRINSKASNKGSVPVSDACVVVQDKQRLATKTVVVCNKECKDNKVRRATKITSVAQYASNKAGLCNTFDAFDAGVWSTRPVQEIKIKVKETGGTFERSHSLKRL